MWPETLLLPAFDATTYGAREKSQWLLSSIGSMSKNESIKAVGTTLCRPCIEETLKVRGGTEPDSVLKVFGC